MMLLYYKQLRVCSFSPAQDTAVTPVVTHWRLSSSCGGFGMLRTVEVEEEVMEKIVNIRPKAMDHLQELRQSQGSEGDIFLRMGVRSGGCSGLSYIMDLVKKVRSNSLP